MNELLRLLTEFGADEEIIALAQRMSETAGEGEAPEGVEPLTDDELDTLLAALMALAEDDEASVALLTEAANGAEQIRDEQTARTEAAAAEEAELARERARLRGETAEDSDQADDDAEGDESDADDEQADQAESSDADDESAPEGAESSDAEQREPVPASGARRAARRAMRARRPSSAEPNPGRDGATITISADVPGFAAGAQVAELSEVDRAIYSRVQSFRGAKGRRPVDDGTSDWLTVASIHGHYPESRRLTDDPRHNARIIEETLQGARTPAALTAAGGLCAPLQPYYGVQTLGNARRPVRDALPAFQGGGGRGGLISMTPLVLGDVAGASIIWTADNDADPTDPVTKPCVRVECGELRTTEIYAIPMCLEFGNFRARTFGEWDAAASDLALVAHARIADTQLLADIEAASLALTSQGTEVSAYRDWLALLVRAVATYRARVRDDDLTFRAIAPSQAPAIFATDFLRGMAGGIGYGEVMRRGRTEIAADLAAHGIQVTWSPDMDVPAAQADATPVTAYPTSIDTALFPEGTFVLLDQGRLDLGVVRDSTLNSTNDFQVFAEDFEAVHHLGHDAYWLNVEVCPSGAVNGTLDPAGFCEVGP